MLGLFSIRDISNNLEYSPIRVSYKIPKFSKSAPLGPMGDGRFSFGGQVKLSYKQCRTFQGEGSTSQPSEITLTADATVYVYVFSNSLSVNLGKTSSKLPSSWAPQIL